MAEETITQITTPAPAKQESPIPKIAHRFDGIALGLGVIAFLALAFEVHSVLNPFIVLFVLYVLLAPFREYRAARKIMLASGVLFAIWFFFTLSGLLIPFILGAVLAYLFNPLVTRLHDGGHLHRTWSSLIIMILFCGVLVAVGWIFLPSLVDQTKEFISRLTLFIRANANTVDPQHVRHLLLKMGIPPVIADEIIRTQAGPQFKKIVTIVPRIVFDIIGGLPKFLEQTTSLIIVPIAMFYFLKDWQKIGPLVNDLFPAKDPARRAQTIANIDRVLYGYVRGQATVAILIGILGAIAYYILGIPYAGLLGVVLAVADLIPIAGMIISLFVVEIVIFLTMVINVGVVLSGLLVIVGLHMLEIYIVSPRIIGQSIGIPPILMILALLVFGYFLGFVGMLIAVPATGVMMLFLAEYRKRNVAEQSDL